MGSGAIWLVAIVSLVAILGLAVYFDQQYLVEDVIEYSYSSFLKVSKSFPDGSDLSHYIPDQSTDQLAVPVSASSLLNENSTQEEIVVAKAVEKATTPQKGIPQYKKLSDKPIALVGHAILADRDTGEHLKPYVYNVLVTITCNEELNLVDGFNFCNTDPRSGRVQTKDAGTDPDTGNILGGYYEYLWRTDKNTSTAFYDVNVIVTSDQLDQKGTYSSYEDHWIIQVI